MFNTNIEIKQWPDITLVKEMLVLVNSLQTVSQMVRMFSGERTHTLLDKIQRTPQSQDSNDQWQFLTLFRGAQAYLNFISLPLIIIK